MGSTQRSVRVMSTLYLCVHLALSRREHLDRRHIQKLILLFNGHLGFANYLHVIAHRAT